MVILHSILRADALRTLSKIDLYRGGGLSSGAHGRDHGLRTGDGISAGINARLRSGQCFLIHHDQSAIRGLNTVRTFIIALRPDGFDVSSIF